MHRNHAKYVELIKLEISNRNIVEKNPQFLETKQIE